MFEDSTKARPTGVQAKEGDETGLGKVKVKVPVIPGVVSWDFEIGGDSLVGRWWKGRPRVVQVAIMTGILALVVLVGFSGWKLIAKSQAADESLPDLYAVRVVPVDESGQPVKEATVRASVGNEPQRVDPGWEIEIPRSKVPEDGLVRFWAQDPGSGGQGMADLALAEDAVPSLRIPLTVPEVSIGGTVTGPAGSAVSNARVSVPGYGGEAVHSDRSGTFVLPVHKPRSHRVRIRAEHPVYGITEVYCFAGSNSCRVLFQ